MIGTIVGRLAVVRTAPSVGRGRRFLCVCECGGWREVSAGHLKQGRVKSCGCLKPRHGARRAGAETAEYRVWRAMLRRCRNPSCRDFKNYGGRGVVACPRWALFANFLEDVGQRPSNTHQLDRIDNDGNYEPGNVRWATRGQQARNKRSNRLLTFDGRTQTLTAWSEECGIRRETISRRLEAGRTVQEALTAPVESQLWHQGPKCKHLIEGACR